MIKSKEEISKLMLMQMPFVMKYNVVVFFSFLSLSFIVFFYTLFFLNNSSGIEYKIIVFAIFVPIFFLFLLFYRKNSSFILSADCKGIYYKIYSRDREFILLDWSHIQSMDILYDGGRELRILTDFNRSIPSPCNGQIFIFRGFQELSFSLGFFKMSKTILTELNELRNGKA